jgi:transposase
VPGLMFIPPANIRVYLALGHTDMRKAINGLSVLVESSMQLDPGLGRVPLVVENKKAYPLGAQETGL